MSDYIQYVKRSGWEDLKPIPQADAPNPLVPIAYTKQYRDAMDTFRALVKVDEKSTRSLEITEVLIRMNPGHYSIWAYRNLTLLAIGADLSKELDLMDELVKEHLKSYQVWQHRRNVVTTLHSSTREIGFTSKALSYDSKNYHTWAYRQWILCHFFSSPNLPSLDSLDSVPTFSTAAQDFVDQRKVWEGELEYTKELLGIDLRNNSAWNHRFFVSFESGMGGKLEVVTEREIYYVKTKLALAPNNPSAWNYLRGILSYTQTSFSTLTTFISPLACIPLDSSVLPNPNDPIISVSAQLPAFLAIEFVADGLLEGTRKGRGQEASELFMRLIEFDPIRENYWIFRAEESKKLDTLQ